MRTHPMHHLKSRGGSLMSQKETPEDHLLEEEEEDSRHVRQDRPLEVVEAAEVEEVAEVEGVAEEAERFHYPDTPPLNQLKSF